MWTTHLSILLTALDLHQLFVSSVNPTYCAFKNDNLRINITGDKSVNDWYRTRLEAEGQKARGVFLNDGFERCEDSLNTSQCYTLWVRPSSTASPYIGKQGCWIHLSAGAPDECQAEKCGAPTNDWAADSRLHFCCCTGNKCNHVESVGKQNPKVESTQTEQSASLSEKKDDTRVSGSPGQDSTYCAFKATSQMKGKWDKMSEEDSKNLGAAEILDDGVTAKCITNNDFCFSYYTLDPVNKSRIVVSVQGCWSEADDNTCTSSICIPRENSHYSHKRSNNSHFCCCRGNMCNNNISRDYIPVSPRMTTESNGPVQHLLRDTSYKERTIVIALLSVFSVAVIILGLYLAYRFCFRLPPTPTSSNNDVENPVSPAFDIDNLKISCLIIKGRFSEVWKGSLNEQDVAVKIYSPTYRQYYYNEKYIYSLPHMEHENIMKFYGGEERILQDGTVQYLLVLQYVPEGTLMNYLKNNTIDWYTMCKMCLTLARGLAHLHADIGTGDDFKATVAHRDINSRNVLVKPDLSLVIADLGFCMTTMGSKLIHKGHTENAEQTSLTDVGTLRYMAPELLDGAVNLRDCEASLKQIDMYAFGLVMWEISSRCSELYQGCPMPEFMLPYHAEAGSHPSFEEMQDLVSRNKVRPKFPEVWKDYNQAIHALKETIEECWDHDAEARLTALCVEERVLEMKTLWSHDNRNKVNKGVTPTINTALLSQVSAGNRSGYQGNGLTQWAGLSSSTDTSSSHIVAEGSTSALIINDIRNSTGTMSGGEPHNMSSSVINERHGSFSTSTMDTTLAVTPSESVQSHPKSQNINAQMNQPLPANQGRNPIVERNTHKRSDEELAVVGNNLFYGKDQSGHEVLSASDSMFDTLTDSLESSLMQNDSLNQACLHNHRLNTARVNDRPRKVVNNPNDRPDNVTAGTHVQVNTSPKARKAKEMGLLGHLALLGKLALSGKFDGKKSVNENQPTAMSRPDSGRKYESVGRHNPMYEPSQSVETEVRLTNTGAVVQPANTHPKKLLNTSKEMATLNKTVRSNSVETDSIEGSEADLQSDSPLISRHRVAPYSKSTSDLSPQKTCQFSKIDNDNKKPRPSTLSLKGHNYNQSHCGSLSSLARLKSVWSQKPVKPSSGRRPLLNGYKDLQETRKHKEMAESVDKDSSNNMMMATEKNGRYSLHDDRLMSDSSLSAVKEDAKLWKSSVSLQQFTSLEEGQPSKPYTDCTC